MTTNNNKHIITNEKVRIRQKKMFYVTFSSTSEVSVVFNISSSDAFLHEQFLVSKYSSVLHALLHSQLHTLEFHK